jgi:Fe-S cluster assembly protein SufB
MRRKFFGIKRGSGFGIRGLKTRFVPAWPGGVRGFLKEKRLAGVIHTNHGSRTTLKYTYGIYSMDSNEILEEFTQGEYKYGFVSDIDTEFAPKGLNEETIHFISKKKNEPDWLLEYRLKAFRHWLTMVEPKYWPHLFYPSIDFQSISYYAAPKQKASVESLDQVDPELLKTFEKLGISLEEQKRLVGMESNIAVDAVIDSVSVKTTFKEVLAEKGIIFCSFSEAVHEHPDLVKQYMGSVVPYTDNFYAALNAAVFSDGSFCYIPKGVRCPMELSTYFRINSAGTGQFERTLIIADEGAYVSYLEGCTAPKRDENQLHAAVVEIIAQKNGEVKYSTVQNWYPGDKEGKGGIYNFVTKRGICLGDNSKISWTQVETGSAITWKYPSVILKGDNSVGGFYSVAVTNNMQQADTGTKMMHIGKNTRSTIISKGISAGKSQNSYRGLVRISKGAKNARNFSQCDSLLMGDKCGAHTFPYIEIHDKSAVVEHEATTSKIGEDQIFYCNQRGIGTEKAIGLIVNGYCREVLNQLPMEFAVEAQKLLSVSLEGSVG